MVRTVSSSKQAARRIDDEDTVTVDGDAQKIMNIYNNMVERHNPFREINTASNYDEFRLAAGYDVNLYDICREPRAPLETTLHIPASSLDEELHCPICTGPHYLRSASHYGMPPSLLYGVHPPAYSQQGEKHSLSCLQHAIHDPPCAPSRRDV
ncbi:unnamed protein product [Aphanomyces euteiches]